MLFNAIMFLKVSLCNSEFILRVGLIHLGYSYHVFGLGLNVQIILLVSVWTRFCVWVRFGLLQLYFFAMVGLFHSGCTLPKGNLEQSQHKHSVFSQHQGGIPESRLCDIPR